MLDRFIQITAALVLMATIYGLGVVYQDSMAQYPCASWPGQPLVCNR